MLPALGAIGSITRHSTVIRGTIRPSAMARAPFCKLMTPQGDGRTLEVAVTFATDTLPHLQLWHDLRPHACVLAIEPCTSSKVSGLETVLRPGDTRAYAVDINIVRR